MLHNRDGGTPGRSGRGRDRREPGIGKGVALELGAAGATVYVTGRTVAAGQHPLPGTVGETAAEVSALGGAGVAVACDHHDDAAVEALFARVATRPAGSTCS